MTNEYLHHSWLHVHHCISHGPKKLNIGCIDRKVAHSVGTTFYFLYAVRCHDNQQWRAWVCADHIGFFFDKIKPLDEFKARCVLARMRGTTWDTVKRLTWDIGTPGHRPDGYIIKIKQPAEQKKSWHLVSWDE